MDRLKCLICFQSVQETLYLSNYFNRPSQICEQCEQSFRKLEGRRCLHCRRKLAEDEMLCTDCVFMHQYFKPLDAIHILYDYDDFMKELIYCYKGRGDIKLADVFARLLLENQNILKRYDVILPLPTSHSKLNSRGFSQMEEIVKIAGIKYTQSLTMKERTKQTELTKKERLQQENPFEVVTPVSGRILLIDDIYTTGLTVHRAAEALRAKGVNMIGVLAFARP